MLRYHELFKHFQENHGVSLTNEELREIIRVVNENYPKNVEEHPVSVGLKEYIDRWFEKPKAAVIYKLKDRKSWMTLEQIEKLYKRAMRL